MERSKYVFNVTHICDESQILRKQISDITISDDEYPAHEEVSKSNYGVELPSPLKLFMIQELRWYCYE
jgi:hypothetical protein